MTKHTIETKDFPEGWEPVAYRVAIPNIEYTVTDDMEPILCPLEINYPTLIVQKTKPREITIVETDDDNFKDESNDNYLKQHLAYGIMISGKSKIWRIKEE